MFIAINHSLNRDLLQGVALIQVEDIDGITEYDAGKVELYDNNGNVVSSTPNPRVFKLFLKNGKAFYINDQEYNRLAALLTSTK